MVAAGRWAASGGRGPSGRAWGVVSACEGRTAEAARDVEECLAYCNRADGEVWADAVDLAKVVSLLDQVGHAEAALALAERLLARPEGCATGVDGADALHQGPPGGHLA